MENKINIAELLKDCPKGMELDCTVFENLTFEEIDEVNSRILCNIQGNNGKIGISFNKFGCYSELNQAKCVIFPKGKTTWEGFQKPFKDGDIVFYNNTIAIFKEWGDETLFRTYVTTYLCCDSFIDIKVPLFGKSIRKEIRFATEEEKARLFKVIKDNGYKWNEETKTLEKLVEPKFKVGDRIRSKKDAPINISNMLITKVKSSSYEGVIGDTTNLVHINFKYQDLYELIPDKLVEPNFNVGDRIKKKDSNEDVVLITDIVNDYYIVETKYGMEVDIYINIQNNYELVPNKFDINTLVPFDSRVLVRHNKDNKWCCSFFSHIDKDLHSHCYKFVTTAGKSYPHCIPYEGNQNLRGTTNDCDEFYKTWE